MRRTHQRDRAQTREATRPACADKNGEAIEIAQQIDQQAETQEWIARVELLAQPRAENGAKLGFLGYAAPEPYPRIEAFGMPTRAPADRNQLHGAYQDNRGDETCELVDAEPALVDVPTARSRRGEEKLHRPDQQQHRPSDEALEAMLADEGWDDVHAGSLRAA